MSETALKSKASVTAIAVVSAAVIIKSSVARLVTFVALTAEVVAIVTLAASAVSKVVTVAPNPTAKIDK
jgi:hypothetical protein